VNRFVQTGVTPLDDPVTGVSACTRVVQLDAPIMVGTSLISKRRYALVKLTTASGSVGHAYALARDLPVAEIVEELAAEYLVGQDAGRVVHIYHSLHSATRAGGRSGPVAKAIGLLDIALWDAKARRLGLPLWRLLGGGNPTSDAMIVAAYPDASRSIGELVEQVVEYARKGFGLLKIARDPDADRMAEWLETLARALPPRSRLVVDCGWAFEGPQQAVAEIASWSRIPVHIAWVEDPLVPEDVAGYQQLHERLSLPIGAGDEAGEVFSLRQLALSHAVDVLRIDVACLGVTGSRGVAAVARALGVPVSYHVYPEVTAHLAAAQPGGAIVESFDPTGNPYDPTYRIVRDGSRVASGSITATEQPGLGFVFQEEPGGNSAPPRQ
jgi:L-alanine-DL-glutamate epimerase-like enolase superfamily enzyme